MSTGRTAGVDPSTLTTNHAPAVEPAGSGRDVAVGQIAGTQSKNRFSELKSSGKDSPASLRPALSQSMKANAHRDFLQASHQVAARIANSNDPNINSGDYAEAFYESTSRQEAFATPAELVHR